MVGYNPYRYLTGYNWFGISTGNKILFCAKERSQNNLDKLMSFFPFSALLVGYIACYAPASCLEYEKKSY